jgi:hypothetical protein
MTLDRKELTYYLRAVIRCAKGRGKHEYSSDFALEKDIERLAEATSKSIFDEIDLDKNGFISLEEFFLWHIKNDLSE